MRIKKLAMICHFQLFEIGQLSLQKLDVFPQMLAHKKWVTYFWRVWRGLWPVFEFPSCQGKYFRRINRVFDLPNSIPTFTISAEWESRKYPWFTIFSSLESIKNGGKIRNVLSKHCQNICYFYSWFEMGMICFSALL